MRRAAALSLLVAVALASLGAARPSGAQTAPAPAPTLAALGIRHVFVVNIENKTFDAAYVSNPNPYLSKTLPATGVLLPQYFGIGHLSLTNYVAQLSGQAPNPTTQSDCQIYMDQQPGVLGPMGQSIGQGCVYPVGVKTLPDQLVAAGLTWHGYMEDMGNAPPGGTPGQREPDRCGEPTNPTGAGMRDGTQTATATNQYAARHNPFVYFHSILDSPLCNRWVEPLSGLAADLSSVATTANFTFISPNLCNDGHDDPCVGTNVRGTKAGGLTAADYWLQQYVPLITASPAFQQDGLLVVTSDESDGNDATACCGEQAGFNTLNAGITGPGGGRTGTVLLGRCVQPGSTSTTPYNHYSLLRSLEDIFGITTGGSDSKGHLGYAGATDLKPFGADVFAGCAAALAGGTGVDPGLVNGGSPAESTDGTTVRPRGILAVTGGLPVAALAVLLLAAAALTARHLTRKAG